MFVLNGSELILLSVSMNTKISFFVLGYSLTTWRLFKHAEDCGHAKLKADYISFLPSPFDSILEAVFTVSPNKQYRGIFRPTTPAQTGPVNGIIVVNIIIVIIHIINIVNVITIVNIVIVFVTAKS